MGSLEHLLTVFTENHIVMFPYFLAIIGGSVIVLCRNTPVFTSYGLQLIAMTILLPALVFVWNKDWISRDAGIAVLSGMTGFFFGSENARRTSRSTAPRKSNKEIQDTTPI